MRSPLVAPRRFPAHPLAMDRGGSSFELDGQLCLRFCCYCSSARKQQIMHCPSILKDPVTNLPNPMKKFSLLVPTLLLLGVPLFAQSAPPVSVPFQARLATQATGADVNGSVSVTFRVYSSISGRINAVAFVA